MSILVPCSCGRSLQVRKEFAGRKGRCPGCGRTLLLPQTAPSSLAAIAQKPRPTAAPGPVQRRPSPPAAGPLRDHADGELPDTADFFARPPEAIGPVSSAHTTLLEGQSPWPLGLRLFFAAGVWLPALLFGAYFALDDLAAPLLVLALSPGVVVSTLASVVVWLSTRFTHTCTYVGQDGLARFVCLGSRGKISTANVFLFRDATRLHITPPAWGIFRQRGDRVLTWTGEFGQRFVLKKTYVGRDGIPDLEHHLLFARAAERAWTESLLPGALRHFEATGEIRFPMGRHQGILLGRNQIEFHCGREPDCWRYDEVAGVTLDEEVVTLHHVRAREEDPGQDVCAFRVSEMANVGLFFRLLERVVRCPVRGADGPLPLSRD